MKMEVPITPQSSQVLEPPFAGLDQLSVPASRGFDRRSLSFDRSSAELGTFQVPLHETNLGLGVTVVHAHGLRANGGEVVNVCNSFITGPFDEYQGVKNPLPDPMADAYLHFTAVPALQPGERALSLRLQPGLLDYYRQIGLFDSRSEVVEVDPDVSLGCSARGFPFTDPMAMLQAASRPVKLDGPFISTFPSAAVSAAARMLGMKPIQSFDPGDLNDKAFFRRSAELYGYKILPGIVLDSLSQVESSFARQLFGNSAVWLKLAHGSGGDLVLKLADSSFRSVEMGLTRLREAVVRAFSSSEFGEYGIDKFWPSGRMLPLGSSVVLEKDASGLGSVVINGSCNLLSRSDGTFSIVDYFQQETAVSGAFCGSAPYDPDSVFPGLGEAIRVEAQKVANLLHDRGFCGFAGFDYFVIEEQGKFSIVLVELNGRPTMSLVPALVARKLSAQSFINTNIVGASAFASMAEFEKIVTVDGCNYSNPQNPSKTYIVPLAMRSLHRLDSDGASKVVFLSNQAKVLVGGATRESCYQLLRHLEREGRFVQI